jgi:hypothetical protein
MKARDRMDILAGLLAAREAGFRAELLSDVKPEPAAALLIDRLDAEGHTIMYGTGDVGKGVIASHWIGQLVALGHVVLILDYEDHRAEWARRIDALYGADVRASVIYVAPPWQGAIWDHATDIKELIDAVGATVVVIDSIVFACRGKDATDPAATTFYDAAVKQFGVPVLSLAHVTKDNSLRYPWGSVFWHNAARVTWSAAAAAGEGHRVILTHRKDNNHRKVGRVLVTIEWFNDLPREVTEVPYMAHLGDMIEEALRDNGPASVTKIVDRLNEETEEGEEPIKTDSVRKALNRGLVRRFRKEGEEWKLAS